jgi:hypothetical protein
MITLIKGPQASSVFSENSIIKIKVGMEQWWTASGGENRSTRKRTSLGAKLSITNPTRNKLE